mgnify:CR=1 FL=1
MSVTNKIGSSTEKEVFVKVKGFDNYEISNRGRVKSVRFNKCIIIKPAPTGKNGRYLSVGLVRNKKRHGMYVHRLVADNFIGHVGSGNKMVVDHIDNNSRNNDCRNLQVITHRDNLSKEKRGNSKYAGVYKNNRTERWVASVCYNSTRYHVGTFSSEYNAHIAHTKKLLEVKDMMEVLGC